MSKTNKNKNQDFLDEVLADREKTDPGITKEVHDELDDARLGAALVRHRVYRELKQSEVATMIGKTQPQIARIEKSPLSQKAQVLIDYCKAVGLANPFEAALRSPEDVERLVDIASVRKTIRSFRESQVQTLAPGTLWEVVPDDASGPYVRMRPVTVNVSVDDAEPSDPKPGLPGRTSLPPGQS